jgi:hypothetical protein
MFFCHKIFTNYNFDFVDLNINLPRKTLPVTSFHAFSFPMTSNVDDFPSIRWNHHFLYTLFEINQEKEQPQNDNEYIKSLLDISQNLYCKTYFSHALMEFTVYPNIYGNCSNIYDNDTISLVIQMDEHSGYFGKARQTLQNWSGPVSLAVFIASNDSRTIYQKLKQIILKEHLVNDYLCIHAVSNIDVSIYQYSNK